MRQSNDASVGESCIERKISHDSAIQSLHRSRAGGIHFDTGTGFAVTIQYGNRTSTFRVSLYDLFNTGRGIEKANTRNRKRRAGMLLSLVISAYSFGTALAHRVQPVRVNPGKGTDRPQET